MVAGFSLATATSRRRRLVVGPVCRDGGGLGGVFGTDEQGFGSVLAEKVPEGLKADAEKAILACPEQAISEVTDDE